MHEAKPLEGPSVGSPFCSPTNKAASQESGPLAEESMELYFQILTT